MEVVKPKPIRDWLEEIKLEGLVQNFLDNGIF
jgi:hypothetical protein